MQTITFEIPDVVLESHKQNIRSVKEEVKRGFVVWEYLNGRLSIEECCKILKTGYREFLELFREKGIPNDALLRK